MDAPGSGASSAIDRGGNLPPYAADRKRVPHAASSQGESSFAIASTSSITFVRVADAYGGYAPATGLHAPLVRAM